jgi:AcrR family transcriptional regulator
MERTTPRRAYRSERRARQAAETRAEVVQAAIALFAERGWAGTTLNAVADAAGVAVETIYGGFRSKKGLLRAAMEAAVVGDVEEVPFAEREAFASFGAGDLEARLRAVASVVADVHERSVGVWGAIIEAASADEEVEAWRAELEAGRRLETARGLQRVFDRKVPRVTVDLVWAVLGPETYLKLIRDAGLTRRQYERAVAEAIRRLVGT